MALNYKIIRVVRRRRRRVCTALCTSQIARDQLPSKESIKRPLRWAKHGTSQTSRSTSHALG